MYTARMHRRCTYASLTVPLVELNREQDVGRLRSAIRDERFVGRPLEVRIFQIDIGEAVTCRRQVDHAPAFAKQRREPIDQYEVTEVIGAELRFESISRMPKRCCHYSRICDDHVEGLTFCQ